MKKLLSVFLCICILGCGLAGCASNKNTENTKQTEAKETAGNDSAAIESDGKEPTGNDSGAKESDGSAAKETDENKAAGNNALKIAIVTSGSGVDDGTFNQNIYSGIQSFIEKYPDATVKPVQESSGDSAAAVTAVADIAPDYDVVVCCGFQFSQIAATAEDNPNVNFILVDSNPAYEDGSEADLPNICAMTFAEQESGFMAGMAAALESKTKKAAFIGGIAYPSNVNYQYGFESGVNYANQQYNTGVELVELPSYSGTDVTNQDVGGNYIGSFADQATGKVIGNALIKEGCDILFVVAGDSGTGVFTAAKEANDVKVIGCDTDQYDLGAKGNENIVLTSAVKVMGKNVEKQLENIAKGNFKGGNFVMKADTDSTGYVKEAGRNQLSEDSIAKLNEAYAGIQSGEIIPAANFNNITPDDFPGLTSKTTMQTMGHQIYSTASCGGFNPRGSRQDHASLSLARCQQD